MPKRIDIAGSQFGFLTAIRRVENVRGRAAWLCRCHCGATTVVMRASLTGKHATRSCGCMAIIARRQNIAVWNERNHNPRQPTPQSLESAHDAGRMLANLWR